MPGSIKGKDKLVKYLWKQRDRIFACRDLYADHPYGSINLYGDIYYRIVSVKKKAYSYRIKVLVHTIRYRRSDQTYWTRFTEKDFRTLHSDILYAMMEQEIYGIIHKYFGHQDIDFLMDYRYMDDIDRLAFT